jgi:predicted alpha/beta hydrolase family esterase
MISKKRVFVVHCWGGKPNTRWYPWLKTELESKNFNTYVPAMPNTQHPRMNAWINHLKKVVGTPDKNCYFVGHSVCCIKILRYLETINVKVGGVVMVAGFATGLGYEDLESFFEKPINWKKIKLNCKKFVAIHSDNDPYVSLHYGTDIFKDKLNANLIIEHNKGHFSTDKNVTKLPSALQAVLKLSK